MPADGGNERLLKCLDKYVEMRNALVRNGIYVSVASMILAAFSRTPGWILKDPIGILPNGWHSAYAPILGPLVVFALFGSFYLSLVELIQFRQLIIQTQLQLDSRAFSPAESFLLQLPFAAGPHDGTFLPKFAVVGRYLIYFGAPVVSYWFLLWDYFEFKRPGEAHPVLDLLFGIGGLRGFKPEAARYSSEAIPWIYPPLQTWLYILCFLVLIWLAIGSIAALRHAMAAQRDGARPESHGSDPKGATRPPLQPPESR